MSREKKGEESHYCWLSQTDWSMMLVLMVLMVVMVA